MPSAKNWRTPIRLHLTNVAGAGASQLLQSLLPALEGDSTFVVERIELPDRGKLAGYRSSNETTVTEIYRRYLPNAISRILECTFLAKRFDGESAILVLGDLPLRCYGEQTVFVQTPNLIKPIHFRFKKDGIKYWISRVLFRISVKRVKAFIVQTNFMQEALERSYPDVVGRVHVISQPVPSWLLQSGLQRKCKAKMVDQGLSLIYPAASYPHKNHSLLTRIDSQKYWPVKELVLTIEGDINPAPNLSWVKCCGFLSPQEMIKAYERVDALLFLSKDESYGFPLLEAMFVGLPIVCPDLPYARVLCEDSAIYFDPDQPESLRLAIIELKNRINCGWWPNWEKALSKIPKDWETVAHQMLVVACDQV